MHRKQWWFVGHNATGSDGADLAALGGSSANRSPMEPGRGTVFYFWPGPVGKPFPNLKTLGEGVRASDAFFVFQRVVFGGLG